MLDASFRICAPVFHRLRWIRSSLFLKEVSDVSQLVGNRLLKGHLLIMYIQVYIWYTCIYIYLFNYLLYLWYTHTFHMWIMCMYLFSLGRLRVKSAFCSQEVCSWVSSNWAWDVFGTKTVPNFQWLVNRGTPREVPPTEGLIKTSLGFP